MIRGLLMQNGMDMPTVVEAMAAPVEDVQPVKRRRSRSARAQDKKLSEAFTEANRRYRKNDGSLRAGRTQADIATLAHKLKKKM
jgi:hypothetical protein